MRYLSLCSGIEAASNAWNPLGWEAVGFSEIEPFPCAVLAHRFPNIPNYGDMTKYKEWENVGQFDVLVGGTPCQSFSVAGLRRGLEDPRGNLMLTYGAIANYFKSRVVVWENVPGVLSSGGGRDFGTFLGMLAECGYGFSYRILDAQYFGVPQRRRRVFVVGYLGDWRRAAAVLFESEGLLGNTPPSREAGKGVAGTISARTSGGGGLGTDFELSGGLQVSAQCFERNTPDGHARLVGEIAPTLNRMGGGQREPCIFTPVVMATGQGNAEITENHAPTLNCNHEAPILALAGNTIGREPENGGNGCGYQESVSYTLTKTDQHGIMQGTSVRRLTPRECERLQGFPDDWTKIPWRGASAENCPDGPRYKAIGNSMAVPVMRWIGERIEKYAATD